MTSRDLRYVGELRDNDGNAFVSYGDTLPTFDGYLPGCLFVETVSGTVYSNIGDVSAASWSTFGATLSDPYASRLNIGDSTSTNSSDPMLNVNRDVDDTGSGNGHCFSDSSDVSRSGDIAYNSYDARTTFSGAEDYDHYAAFQDGCTIGSSGTTDLLYGLISAPTVNSGTVTDRRAVDVFDVVGTGTVATQYGLHVRDLTAATTNYAIYTNAGYVVHEDLCCIGSAGAVDSSTILLVRGDMDAASAKGIQMDVTNSTGNYTTGCRATATSDYASALAIFAFYCEPTYNSAGNTLPNSYGCYVSPVCNNGTITNSYGVYVAASSGSGSVTNEYGVYVASGDNYFGGAIAWAPSSSETPAANGDLTVEATNNTTLTFKLKGTDGTVRSGTLALS